MAFDQNLDSVVLLDGAFGTELQKKILPAAKMPEEYNLTAPAAIESIHRSYIEAGSDIVYANTFGASPMRAQAAGLDAGQLIAKGIEIAKRAAKGTSAKVALDIGPLGVLMEPMGSMSIREAARQFSVMVKAGVKAGADLIVIETMSDLAEVKAALMAAKQNSTLPVFVTMTFEENGRTFSGCTLENMVCLAQALGADAVGINCSLGPAQLAPLLEKLCSLTDLPVIAKPNAGLPDPVSGGYHLTDEEFVEASRQYLDAGVSIAGGCCGTTPATIRALKEECAKRRPADRSATAVNGLCTQTRFLDLNKVCVVGERINPTGKKRLQAALAENDYDYIARLAIRQQEEGADLLDVNVGAPGIDETKALAKAVRAIQAVCDLPLLLDSSNPEALEAALETVVGRAAINSVNGKEESMEAVFPIAKKYGCPVVALCLDEKGIPQSAQERLEIAQRIRSTAARWGIDPQSLWFDTLTLTVSAQQDQAMETLAALQTISSKWKCPTILGVSNISFGLPGRPLMTRTFLNAALAMGLRFAIINPSVRELMDTIAAWRVLCGEDKNCSLYVEKYSNAPEQPQSAKQHESDSLFDAVVKGLDKEASRIAREKIKEGADELALTESDLIPALDKVGQEYEKGSMYLPNLLSSAAAAQAVFEEIRLSLAKKGQKQDSKGTIILATVAGDVHDIGKNIVRTLLENYGYKVIDLGKDTPAQKVLDAAKEHQAKLVGLSALMTTTLPAMEETISLLHTLKNPPLIMVGGAVVTKRAAMQMKADFYARDARESVRIANQVFGHER